MSAELILRRLETELTRTRFRYRDEKQLHDGIAAVLDAMGVSYTREHVATEEDRFDFFVQEGVVIEVKIGGGISNAAAQIKRYAQLDIVKAIVCITTKHWPFTIRDLNKKPFAVIHVQRIAF